MKIVLEKLLTIDDTGMPKAPTLRQLQTTATRELWSRDKTKDKQRYIAEVGVIYYMGDPKSPARQQGLSDEECLKLAIENYNLPKDYKPDELVQKLIDQYYKDNITEAGIALEAVQRSLHLVSKSATKINDMLQQMLDSSLQPDQITTVLSLIDSVGKKVSEIPALMKSLNVAYENLIAEEEQAMARGKKNVLSSMNANDY